MESVIGFIGTRRVASGNMLDVATTIRRLQLAGEDTSPLVFDAVSSRAVELDLRGSVDEVAARYASPTIPLEASDSRGRGRPKLGVVAREVTLLPRHWDWLGQQRGGASAALRRLVDTARAQDTSPIPTHAGQESLYRFLTAMAGNEKGYEEAVRALFAGDGVRFLAESADWPGDVRAHALDLWRGTYGQQPSAGDDR
jgi:hypothetical protein